MFQQNINNHNFANVAKAKRHSNNSKLNNGDIWQLSLLNTHNLEDRSSLDSINPRIFLSCRFVALFRTYLYVCALKEYRIKWPLSQIFAIEKAIKI